MTTTKLYQTAESQPLFIDALPLRREEQYPSAGLRRLIGSMSNCKRNLREVNALPLDLWDIEEISMWADSLSAVFLRQVQSAKDRRARATKAAQDHAYAQQWRDTKNSPDGIIRARAKRQGRIAQATALWGDKKKMRALYAEARRKTRETGIKHVVDHKVPLVALDAEGNHIACGLHTDDNMVVITESENLEKWAWFNPDQMH